MLGMLMAMAIFGVKTYRIVNSNDQDAIEYPGPAVARRWRSSVCSVCINNTYIKNFAYGVYFAVATVSN